ncbi:MAG: helix-turn-helix domain-containing protein [Gammaproteobacteria bacterium]
MDWARILAYITGTVDQELLLRNEYLVAENRILKAQLKTPLRLTDADRMTLAEIAHRLGRKALEDVANVVKPETLMGWYRRLVARKFDGSKSRRYPGRPRIDGEIEQLVVRMAKENSDWGYEGKDNVLLFPTAKKAMNRVDGPINCKERLGGLLKYYHREAA